MRGTWGQQALYTNTQGDGWWCCHQLPSHATPQAEKRETRRRGRPKLEKGGAEKSDRPIGLTTRPRKGIYSWRRTQTPRVYCLSKLFFRSQWTCRLCEISRGLSLKYSIKRPDEIYTRPASNDRPLESGATCSISGRKKFEFPSFRLIVHIYIYISRRWITYTMICFSYASSLLTYLLIIFKIAQFSLLEENVSLMQHGWGNVF